MRSKRKRKAKNKNISLAILFFALLLFLFLTSILFKTIDVFKRSKFDGNHRFTIAVVANGHGSILSFSPEDKTISRLKIEEKTTQKDLEALGVPIDSRITASQDWEDYAKSFVPKAVVSYKNLDTDLTIVDLLRIWFFQRNVSREDLKEEVLSSVYDTNNEVATLFIDPTVLEEKKTIQIINSAGVPGLAGRLSNFITNMGGNVILLSSTDDREESQVIYKEESYTVDKLSESLGFKKVKRDETNISDIIIIVGEEQSYKF